MYIIDSGAYRRTKPLKTRSVTPDKGDCKTRLLTITEPILGAIAAGGLVEPFTEEKEKEKLDLSNLFRQSNCFALRVIGDSMIEDLIAEGDVAIMRSLGKGEELKDGEIVAARVEGSGTTLKRFYRQEDTITLQPSNRRYDPIEVTADRVEIQGILIGVWRGYQPAYNTLVKS
nr:LexA family transcriptional regulator [Anaplasma marginale]